MHEPDNSDEIRVRDLPADEARSLLLRIRAKIVKDASEGLSKLDDKKHAQQKLDDERREARRAELRAQREALENEEVKP